MRQKRKLLLESLSVCTALIGSTCTEPPKDLSSNASASSSTGSHSDKKNMRWVGHNDLQGRAAYQPTIHQQGGRSIAYVGHHTGQMMNPLTGVAEWNGTSLVDVTDPRRPTYIAHIPGPSGGTGEAGGAQMVRVCDGRVLPAGVPGKVYMLRTNGSSSHQVWDTTDPRNPTLLTTVVAGLSATHKNWWECETGIAYLVAGANAPGATNPDGWKSQQHMKIYDLSNPAAPTYIRDYGLVGSSPASTGPMPVSAPLHGPISVPSKNRVYMPWGVNSNGVVQILDRSKLLPPPYGTAVLSDPGRPTDAELLSAQVGRVDMSPDQGAHTTFPVFGVPVPAFAKYSKNTVRDILVTLSEGYSNRCQEAPHLGFLLDITTDSKPWPISTVSVDERSGSPNFCSRGGRFGTHSSNESFYAPYYGKLIFMSYFNAGTRVFDIRDPFHPAEVAHFVPPVTSFTQPSCFPGNPADCKLDIMTNNVELDDRGLAFAVDRAGGGLDILSLSGDAADIVNGRSSDYQDCEGDDH